MVLVAAAGVKPTGGYSIHLDAVVDSGEALKVTVRTVSPGPQCAVTLALTYPVDVAVVTRRAARVEFEEKTDARSCS